MADCLVTQEILGGTLFGTDGEVLAFTEVVISLVSTSSGSPLIFALDGISGDPIAGSLSIFSDGNGKLPNFFLWPNDRGASMQGIPVVTRYCMEIQYPGSEPYYTSVPTSSDPITWHDFMQPLGPFPPNDILSLLSEFMAAWGLPVDGEIPVVVPDTDDRVWILLGTPIIGSTHGYDGVRLWEGAGKDYIISGNIITFAIAPLNPIFDYRKALL